MHPRQGDHGPVGREPPILIVSPNHEQRRNSVPTEVPGSCAAATSSSRLRRSPSYRPCRGRLAPGMHRVGALDHRVVRSECP
jgi:hypothetical protein